MRELTTKGVKVGTDESVVVIDLAINGELNKFVEALTAAVVETGNKKILYAWTDDKSQSAIFVLR